MNKKVFLVVMAALLCNKGLFGEEQPKSYVGEEIVVTATKTLNSIADAGGASVTVITSADIKASGKETVEELLKGVAGIDVVSNGGLGSQTTLFIRGGDAKNTLVLVDGVPLNDPSTTNRTANFANLTLDNVERIEVVRGTLSALYGSNATSGVINIITKKGDGSLKVYAGIEGGSYGTYKVYGGGTGKTGNTGYSLNLARLKSDGFSFADNRNPAIPHNGNTSEKDGYQNTSLSGSFSYDFSSETMLEGTFRYTDASVKYDDNAHGYTGDRFNGSLADPYGLMEQHSDTQQYVGRIALLNKAKPLSSTLFVQLTDEDRDYFNNDGIKTNLYGGATHEVGWQGDLHVAESNTLTFGLSGKNESMKYSDYVWGSSPIDKNVLSWNMWTQDQLKIGSLNIVSGVRYENHETFGDKITWRVAPSYRLGKTMVKATYGTGFLAPSLYQLYSDYGSETLKAETSKGWDAGVEHHLRENLRVGVTYFTTVFDNRIDFDMVTWKYAQLAGESKTRGVESFLEWQPQSDLQFATNYTWNKTEDPQGKPLVRRPENKVGLTGSYKISKAARLSANMQWVDKRMEVASAKDQNGNSVGSLSSYFLFNMAGSYKLSDSVELYGRIDNVFDRYYEEAWGYATPGRSAYAGIKVFY